MRAVLYNAIILVQGLALLLGLPMLAVSCTQTALAPAATQTPTATPTTTPAPAPTSTPILTPILGTPSESSVPQSIGDVGLYSVTDFGAVGDGKHDDSKAFQAAINAAAIEGGAVLVPSVGGGKGYVLTETVYVKPGVTLIGSLAGFAINGSGAYLLPESFVKGPKIFARPSRLNTPLFQMEPGSTVRGLWILYDQQPMPSDEEFQDPSSVYYYPSFEEAKRNFFRDHVKAYGPTFYIPWGDNVVIEDISADRYYDFFFLKKGARVHVNRMLLYGYNKTFVVEESLDVNTINDVSIVPGVGPTAPAHVEYLDKTWRWIYAIIASQPSNVGLHIGQSDGYNLSQLSFHGVHTAIRLGASYDFPIRDPVEGTTWSNSNAMGPWGQMSNILVDACNVGIHFVWPTTMSTRISNLQIHLNYDDGSDFEASEGTGNLKNVARQAAFLFEPTYSRSNNISFIPTVLVSNFTGCSFTDPRYSPTSSIASEANGRLFLVGGDVSMEFFGFLLMHPYDDENLMIATASTAGDVNIRIRGYVRNGNPDVDKEVGKNGVKLMP